MGTTLHRAAILDEDPPPSRRAARTQRCAGEVINPQADAAAIGTVLAQERQRPARAERTTMLYWTATFFIIALIAALFGFTGLAAGAASIAKILFFIFIVLFVISLIAHALRRGP
jgi:uncharacterized membrane protein YtjA (UPF0391 family)